MAVKIGDFVAHLKRTSQYGQVAVTNDQATLDILSSINKRLAAIWGRANWKWNRETLKFQMQPNVRQYEVLAVSGSPVDRIQDIIPYDSTGTFLQGKPLQERTTRDFYEYHATAPAIIGNTGGGSPVYNIGFPTDYYVVGQGADGNWIIIVDPVPNLVAYLGGYAKGILTTYQVADVVANNPILYFPNGVVLDALFSGCMIDLALIKGMPIAESFPLEAGFEKKIGRLVADQVTVSSDNTPPTRRMPPTVARLRRRRC